MAFYDLFSTTVYFTDEVCIKASSPNYYIWINLLYGLSNRYSDTFSY